MTEIELKAWLEELATGVAQTRQRFAKNLVNGCPIPFFGNVLAARVLTVGVNPSPTEFADDRRWVAPLKQEPWRKRLLGYFTWPKIPAHPWFETWSICLEHIGGNYAGSSAAHIDVSPRTTTPMLTDETDKAEFRKMAVHDSKWMFDLLQRLPQVQLLLIAGPIPLANGQKQQLVEFIRTQAPIHGFRWCADRPLPRLIPPSGGLGMSVFACPYDPKSDGLYAMVRDVYRSREVLRAALCQPPPQDARL